jgi:thiosulfate dehydrogenase [quinone] large subunit
MTNPNPKWTDAERAHAVLRLTLGLNIAIHGLVRVGHPLEFADALVAGFSQTPLPALSVKAFAVGLPFLETAIGLAVLLGWRFRAALMLGGVVLASLTAGACLKQDWEIAGLQLIYALVYFALTLRAGDLRLALDTREAR